MYNTTRGGGGEGGGVDVKKWLADNKLTEVEKVFLERDIQIEELADFEAAELADFAKDLGLDTLQRRRFVKAIQDMRQAKNAYRGGESDGVITGTTAITTTTTGIPTSLTVTSRPGTFSTTFGSYGESGGVTTSSRSGNVHVMMSPQEHKAMNKLQQYLDKCNSLLQQLSQYPNTLKGSEADCGNDVNEKFDRVAAAIEDKRKQLVRDVDRLKQEKEFKLKEQLATLLGYQQMIGGGKQEYEAVMANAQLDVNTRKKEVVRMCQTILTRKGINLIMATQPKMQMPFEPSILEKFLKELEIDDCDQPQAPILTLIKTTYNTATVEWRMSHPSLIDKVQDFSIEFAVTRKLEEKKSKKSKKKKGKHKKKKGSDDESGSEDEDSGSASKSEEESEEESDGDKKKRRATKTMIRKKRRVTKTMKKQKTRMWTTMN